MWNKPDCQKLQKLPKLYETEHISACEKLLAMHFFFGSCDWYVVEFDGVDTFFGYVILGGDLHNAEWGYFSLIELDEIKFNGFEVDVDTHWKTTPAGQVERIKEWI